MLILGVAFRYQGVVSSIADVEVQMDMGKCPNCGKDIEEGHYMCNDCGTEITSEEETRPTVEDAKATEGKGLTTNDNAAAADLQAASMAAGMAVPEPMSSKHDEPRVQKRTQEKRDTWDRIGDAWNIMNVGAQIAAISGVIGLIGFAALLFTITHAGVKAPLVLWILIMPFSISLYLLFSSADASLRMRILNYAGVSVLGSLWFLFIVYGTPIEGLWHVLSFLGLLGLIGGGFIALFEATKEIPE